MSKLLHRLVKRREAAPARQPARSGMKPKAKLTALYSFNARYLEEISFEKG